MTIPIDLSNPAHGAVVIFCLMAVMGFSYGAGWLCHREENNQESHPIDRMWCVAMFICIIGLISCFVNLIWKAL